MSTYVQSNRQGLGWISVLVFSGLLASAVFAEDKKPDNKETEPSELMMCPMLAGLSDLQIHADSPDALLARAKELQLEESQVERLRELQQKARKQARKILTAKQRQSLSDVSKQPLSMAQLAHMRVKQEQQNGGEAKEKMCPWCMKSMEREAEKKRQSWKENGWADTKGKDGAEKEKEDACKCPCCAKKEKADTPKQTQSQGDQLSKEESKEESKEDCHCSCKGKTTEPRVNKDEAEKGQSDVAESTSKPTTE